MIFNAVTYYITALPQYSSLNSCAQAGVEYAVMGVSSPPRTCRLARNANSLPAIKFRLPFRAASHGILRLPQVWRTRPLIAESDFKRQV